MRRAIATAAALMALAAGCKSGAKAKPDDPAAGDPAGGDGTSGSAAPRTGPSLAMPATITVPLADGASWPPRARIVILTAAGIRLLPDGRPPAVDASGKLELPDGEPLTLDGLAALPPEASVVIVAEARANAGVLPPVLGAIGLRCWGLGVGSGGVLAALASQPCPPTAPTDPALVQLAVWVRHGGTMVGLSRVDELTEVRDLAALEPHLREQKQTAFFADRTDLALAVDDDITVGELATALGAALRAGFTGARWIPPAALPVRLADGVGTGAAPGTGTPHASGRGSGIAAATPAKIKFGDITGSFAGLTADEINRVVRARAGIMRACYQHALAGDAALAGDVTLAIDIAADGTVASVDATGGSLAKGDVGTCAAAQAMRMRFPAKGGAKVIVPIAFTAK